MSKISLRFSLSRKVPTDTGTMVRISALFSFCASSSTNLNIDKERDRVPLIVPWPRHLGHSFEVVSLNDGRKRCLDISRSPNREILPTCTLALSISNASRIRFSTSL